MRPPRRVPWATLAELEEVCNNIFADDATLATREAAFSRLCAWRAIVPLPHALEATATLLATLIQDEKSRLGPNVGNSRNSLSLRLSYSSALTRLVNGLVDPLQLGAYARSIASIAAQIGLPAWLVELRHAATHEDLPSLEILREGARESMSWLLHNYFTPTLFPVDSSSRDLDIQSRLTPISPLLKEYKAVMKIVTRDTSLKKYHEGTITKLLRDIERWVTSAKVAASAIDGSYWDDGPLVDEDDVLQNIEPRERWALERLTDELLSKGALIPVSAKKRLLRSNAIGLSTELTAIWSPLLLNLQSHHPYLPALFISRIVTHLLSNASAETSSSASRDRSFDMCMASWAAWTINTWPHDSQNPALGLETIAPRRESFVVNLISGLGALEHTSSQAQATNALINVLCENHDKLQDIKTSLLAIMQAPSSGSIWKDEDATLMQSRLNTLMTVLEQERDASVNSTENTGSIGGVSSTEFPTGWRSASVASWKSCPIGVYVEC